MRHRPTQLLLVCITLALAGWKRNAVANDANRPVAVYENSFAYALVNGNLTALIYKASGDIYSLKYQGKELLAAPRPGGGNWFEPIAGKTVVDRITINPSSNGGQCAEVSISTGSPLINDIRWTLQQGDKGIFVRQIIKHPGNFPAAHMNSGGFQLRLDPRLFDHLSAGKTHSHEIPSAADWMQGRPFFSPLARLMVSGKFAGQVVYGWDDAAVQMDAPAYGFWGAKTGVGIWIINPSSRYLSRGGNVIEPTGWLDAADGAPTLMNRWGGEPAGAGLSLARGDNWSHVIGPFMLYCNAGSFQDAENRAADEAKRWPYPWAQQRPRWWEQPGQVGGQIVLQQSPIASAILPQAPPVNPMGNVGAPIGYPLGGQGGMGVNRFALNNQLHAPASPTTRPQTLSNPRGAMVGISSGPDWQSNFFDDQIWVRVADDGKFEIPVVPPGSYNFHVYCDGQIGEATAGGLHMQSGQTVDLGQMPWTPPQYGDFVWELGSPDRSAAEFRHGHDASRWGLWTKFPSEFPNGVNFTIGKSDPAKDWNYAQFRGTAWKIHFTLGFVPDAGEGFLRIALAGRGPSARLIASINNNVISGSIVSGAGTARSSTAAPIDDIAHDQVSGSYSEVLLPFSLLDLQTGDNVLTLAVDGSSPTDGMMYDYLRMEIRADSAYMAGTNAAAGGYTGPALSPGKGSITGHYVGGGDLDGRYGGAH